MRFPFLRLLRRFSLVLLLALTCLAAARAQPSSGGPQPTATPLPVDLLGITARNVGPRNKVAWSIANEHNLVAYVVERSADAVAFERLTKVAAADKPDYSVYDNAPYTGRTYYRLILIDVDGSTASSKTVDAVMGIADAVVVSATPNPFGQELGVAVSGTQGGQLRLSDGCGRTVATGTVANGEAVIRTGNIAAGPYFLQFSNGAVSKTIKVTRQ